MISRLPAGRANDLAATTVLSRWKGQLRVTAICKATFSFAYDGEMPLAPPLDIARGDVHAAKNPMRSVRVCSDVAPHLDRVDVVFVGRAHARGGTPTERMEVRLAIADDEHPVLDKRLAVIGDRSHADAPPTPFKEIPIVYERALGGLGVADNPLGVGAGADAKTLPNIVHVDPDKARQVAGFGPRAASWPARKKLLRGRPRPSPDGVAELPDDVDWIYFQSAPADQWLERLPPRAWIVLEGLNPRNDLMHMRLPPVRAFARLVVDDEVLGEPFELQPDILFIDGEAEHCTVTFRGSFAAPFEEVLDVSWVAFAIDLPGRPFGWPNAPTEESAEVPKAKQASGTVAIDDRPKAAAGGPPAGHAPTGTMIVDPASFTPAVAPKHAATGTMIVDAGSFVAASAPAGRFAGTQIVEAPPPFVAPLPFQGARTPARKSDAPPALPGAPWAGGPAPAVEKPRPAMTGTLIEEPAPSTSDARTMVQRAPLPAPPPPVAPPPQAPPPPAPPPPAAEPPKAPPAPMRAEDAYQQADPRRDQAPVAAPKPKAALPEKPDIGSALYRRKK